MADENEIRPNRAVEIVKAPHVDEVIVIMSTGDWERFVRLLRAFGMHSEAEEIRGTTARIVAANNKADYVVRMNERPTRAQS